MAAGSNRKKTRAHKTSRGVHGSTHHPLGEVEKVLLGKGRLQALRPLAIKVPWRGVGHPKVWDAEQARWNIENLPFLAEFKDE